MRVKRKEKQMLKTRKKKNEPFIFYHQFGIIMALNVLIAIEYSATRFDYFQKCRSGKQEKNELPH